VTEKMNRYTTALKTCFFRPCQLFAIAPDSYN